MSTEVIDILHRLRYEVHDDALHRANGDINKYILQVERLEKEITELKALMASAGKGDVEARKVGIEMVNKYRQEVTKLNEDIRKNVLENKELKKMLDQQVSSIKQLTTELEKLKKARESGNKPLPVPPAPLTPQFNVTPSTMALSNIVRDAPFGFIGIQNNVTQLFDSLVALNKQTGSTLASLKLMAGALTGVSGIGLGISILTSLITTLTMKYGSLGNAIEEIFGTLTKAEKAQQALNDALKAAEKDYVKAYTAIQEMKRNIQQARDGLVDKEKVVKLYNETLGKTIGAVKTLDEVEKKLTENAKDLIQFTLLKAAAQKALEKAAESAFNAEINNRKKLSEFSSISDNILLPEGGVSSPGYVPGQLEQTQKAAKDFRKARQEERKKEAQKEFEDERTLNETIANKLYEEAEKLAKEKGFLFDLGSKANIDTRSIENVYEQKLQELKVRLAKITEATLENESTIRAKISEVVKKGQLEIDKLFKDKKLTEPQRDTLRALVDTIGDAELSKELTDFNKKRLAAHQKIEDELNALILTNEEKRIQLIRDDFERQTELIDIEARKQLEALDKAKQALLKENEEGRKTGLLDPATAESNAKQIEAVYTQLIENVVAKVNQNKAALSLTLFDSAQEFDKTFFTQEQAEEAERVAVEVKNLSDTYVAGKITYEKYQRELTKILRRESANRRQITIRETETELDLLQRRLAAAQEAGEPAAVINRLEQRIAALRTQLANLKKDAAQGEGTDTHTTEDNQSKVLRQRIQLFGDLASTGINAARQIADAEEQSVNRQIAAQERRVERARAIADRGNAKVLQAEEERLQELSKQREEAGRRQTSLNAAQTASAALLAVANAAAMGDGYSAAARVIAVVAALGAGYALVKELTADNVPAYRDGEIDIKGPGTTTSDSITARISRGESVITADGTAKNKELLEEINRGKRYQIIRDNLVAKPLDYQRLVPVPLSGEAFAVQRQGQAAAYDYTRLEKQIKELTKVVEEKPTASWHLDRRGFVTMYQDQIRFEDNLKKL